MTRNSIRLELASMRVREFSSAQTSKPATLILAPFALHGATIADFAPGHSIVETLQHAGVSPLLLVECKSATPSMRFFSIDTYLAELNVVIDALGGTVNLVGLCQGGWLSLIYAAQFPAKVNSLVLAGSPIDLDAAPSRLVQAARTADLNTVEQLVRSGQGRVLGQAMLDFRGFWGVRDLDPPTVAEILQADLSQEMFERFRAWHRWTVDLPGTFYLQVVRQLFRENQLARAALKRSAAWRTSRRSGFLCTFSPARRTRLHRPNSSSAPSTWSGPLANRSAWPQLQAAISPCSLVRIRWLSSGSRLASGSAVEPSEARVLSAV